jgi:hypothetical protein
VARNPFHQLYVGERIPPSEFVAIFSDKLVKHATQLFEPGNVVLTGVQGSGKSMLFKLLQPEVRLQYLEENAQFPISERLGRFIGAGINVNIARCNEFGQRRAPVGDYQQELMFADFLNYFLVSDILKSIETIATNSQAEKLIGVSLSDKTKNKFVNAIRNNAVWEGYLGQCESWQALKDRIEERLTLYRRFLGHNDIQLNDTVANTKTAAGEPMRAAVEALRLSGILAQDTNVFVLIDQYEELATITDPDGNKADFRGVVNRILNQRDPTVSYRVGTRGYAWRDHLSIFGTDARLEQDRDFKLVALDELLSQREDSSTAIFSDFAGDVFQRRVDYLKANEKGVELPTRLLEVMNHSQAPKELAKQYGGKDPAGVLKFDAGWPSDVPAEITDGLSAMAVDDPLSAKLGEIWIRQKGWAANDSLTAPPWMTKKEQYWRKERIEPTLLAIAGIRKQRAIWSGEEDILGLSGRNILIFLSICQLIWENGLKASDSLDGLPEIPIRHSIQNIGIVQAGKYWMDKLPFEYGRSRDRHRFIQNIGEMFRKLIISDRKLSNPGHYGFSLDYNEFVDNDFVHKFLIELADFGNITMSEHTTKNKDGKRRMKFHLNPIYCPIYRIPYQRTKEPKYVKCNDVETWMVDSGILESTSSGKRTSSSAHAPTPLFDDLEG